MLRLSAILSFLIIFLLSLNGCTFINNLFKRDQPPPPPVEEIPPYEEHEKGEEIEEIEPVETRERPFPDIEIDKNNYLVHTLKRGETLSVVSQHYYGDAQKYSLIAWFNGIPDVDKIYAGQKLKIPVIKTMRAVSPPVPKPRTQITEKNEKETPLEPPQEPEDREKAEEIAEKTEKGTVEAAHIQPETQVPPEETTPPEPETEPQQAVKVDDQRLIKQYQKAMNFYKQEKYYEARGEFRNIIEENPSYEDAQKYHDMSDKIIYSIQKGTRSYYAGQFEDSFDEFSKIREMNKNSAIANNYLKNLVPSMIEQAKGTIKDKPCDSINLLNKVLSYALDNSKAKSLLQQARSNAQTMGTDCQ